METISKRLAAFITDLLRLSEVELAALLASASAFGGELLLPFGFEGMEFKSRTPCLVFFFFKISPILPLAMNSNRVQSNIPPYEIQGRFVTAPLTRTVRGSDALRRIAFARSLSLLSDAYRK
jgi:hypothetical protein